MILAWTVDKIQTTLLGSFMDVPQVVIDHQGIKRFKDARKRLIEPDVRCGKPIIATIGD